MKTLGSAVVLVVVALLCFSIQRSCSFEQKQVAWERSLNAGDRAHIAEIAPLIDNCKPGDIIQFKDGGLMVVVPSVYKNQGPLVLVRTKAGEWESLYAFDPQLKKVRTFGLWCVDRVYKPGDPGYDAALKRFPLGNYP